MKKTILMWMLLVLMSVNAFAYTFTRTVPSSVQAGQQFTVTYTASDSSSEYFVSWRDTITGGCTPNYYENFLSKTASDQVIQMKSITMTAPTSGSCGFSGNYKFAGQTEQQMATGTVTVSGSCTVTNQQASSKCDNNNIYYYDNCNNKGTLKSTCSNGCISGDDQCITTTSCPSGQTKCSDNVCRTSCTTTNNNATTSNQSFDFIKCISGSGDNNLKFFESLTNFDCFRISHLIAIISLLILYALIKK